MDEAEGFEKSLLSKVIRLKTGEERSSSEDHQVFDRTRRSADASLLIVEVFMNLSDSSEFFDFRIVHQNHEDEKSASVLFDFRLVHQKAEGRLRHPSTLRGF